ncbi:MAG: hypothetical protein KAV00_15245 [Phycisphaerae bacterium]|nr:hypothetical protein [Phycisphaerae bacterium]
MNDRDSIGFDRDIWLDWLEATAGKVAAGANSEEVRQYLHAFLEGVVSNNGPRSARQKTITVLCRIWSKAPEGCMTLRDHAVGALASAPASERVAIHWAMCIAAYPFFADVVRAVGRLITIQGDVDLAAVYRRIAEIWGQRPTAKRAARRVVRSIVRWGLLKDTERRGIYRPLPRKLPIGQPVGDILIQALLVNNCFRPIPVGQFHADPVLFPFELMISAGRLRSSGLFQIHRQGLDIDLVELA